MKKILLICLLCVSFTELKSQSLMTRGEIYNYAIGDVFVKQFGGYISPPTYSKTIITDKYYSTLSDTIFYIGDTYSYTPCPPPCTPTFDSIFGSSFYYTNLNDTVGTGFGKKPTDFNCIDTNGYTGTWLDTTYYNPNYCNILSSKISFLRHGPILIDTCWTYFEAWWGYYEYAKGLGDISYYYNNCADGGFNCQEGMTLRYYIKGSDSCGISPFPTGLNKYEKRNYIVNISPNPFSYQATISFEEVQNNLTIKLTDVFGKDVKSTNFSGLNYTVEKGELKEGIYFLKMFDNEKMFTKKIIIQ